MLTIYCPAVHQIALVDKYIEVGALIDTGIELMLIDRAAFSDKPAKNIKQRYQAMDDQENVIQTFSSRRAGLAFIHTPTAA